ncbi:10871_t:CDS:2 [Paraglomus brasilianum]|uniref:10871_t:CDS:1 n=1 Tax=Paraglomus brasilianum TaxID=144538 RepID=A0A9N8ZCG4_9GLOM|nr:10871_t:CDS:2 [Paraglomus brasilianum]
MNPINRPQPSASGSISVTPNHQQFGGDSLIYQNPPPPQGTTGDVNPYQWSQSQPGQPHPPPPGPGYTAWDGFPNAQPPQHHPLQHGPHAPHPAHSWDSSNPPAPTDESGNYGQLGQPGHPQQLGQNPVRPDGREGTSGPHGIGDLNQPLDGALEEEKSIAYEDPNLPKDFIKILSRTLYVGGVTQSTTKERLWEIFSCHGKVVSVTLNYDKNNAFVKMDTRNAAIRAIADKRVKVRWGVGFGPKDCYNFAHGESLIPLDRLTETDRKWLLTSKMGGTGGRPILGGIVLEEPDIIVGEGYSSGSANKRVMTQIIDGKVKTNTKGEGTSTSSMDDVVGIDREEKEKKGDGMAWMSPQGDASIESMSTTSQVSTTAPTSVQLAVPPFGAPPAHIQLPSSQQQQQQHAPIHSPPIRSPPIRSPPIRSPPIRSPPIHPPHQIPPGTLANAQHLNPPPTHMLSGPPPPSNGSGPVPPLHAHQEPAFPWTHGIQSNDNAHKMHPENAPPPGAYPGEFMSSAAAPPGMQEQAQPPHGQYHYQRGGPRQGRAGGGFGYNHNDGNVDAYRSHHSNDPHAGDPHMNIAHMQMGGPHMNNPHMNNQHANMHHPPQPPHHPLHPHAHPHGHPHGHSPIQDNRQFRPRVGDARNAKDTRGKRDKRKRRDRLRGDHYSPPRDDSYIRKRSRWDGSGSSSGSGK